MRIGIDAKWLWRGPPSGRRVVRNLTRSLLELATGDEIHLFLDARSQGAPLPLDLPENRRHYVWASNNQLSNLIIVPRAADRLGLDVVLYQNFVPLPWTARHARVASVQDVIFASHPEFFTRTERLYFAPLRYLTSTADRVCTGSETERRRLIRHGYAREDRIDVVPNAVDSGGEFVPREALAEAERLRVTERYALPPRFVLCAGRVNVRKNVATLVRAMRLVHSDLVLVVAGAPDGTCADLTQVAASAGVAAKVRLLGAVPDDDLRALYALATLLCYPTLDEGFGLPPLEAMAAGTPVVASNSAVLRETCGDAALHVDASDPAAIAGAIDRVAADADLRAALRRAGFARAATFTWKRSAERLLSTIRLAAQSVESLPHRRAPRARATADARRAAP
jgi:glycosyltransferase involved in cell wall biosynthesis